MNFLGHYILIGKAPVPEMDLLRWDEWFDTANRTVARTSVTGPASRRAPPISCLGRILGSIVLLLPSSGP